MIIRQFYPAASNWDKLLDIVEAKFGKEDEFSKLVTAIKPSLLLVLNMRDCLEHQLPGVIIRDLPSRRQDRFWQLEKRVDRLVMRQMVGEVIIATATALVLRAFPDDPLRGKVILELRKAVSASASGHSDPRKNEFIALQLDEDVARLIDQIERIVRLGTFNPSTSSS